MLKINFNLNKAMKLSIIIPVYNVEKYIKECLESCLTQENVTANDYEIIIINDGSTDNSIKIAEKIVEGYVNVTIISQANAGQSVARNKGIALAKGDYIWFVDADDWIAKDAVSIILNKVKSSPDILMVRSANNIDGKLVVRQKLRKEGFFSSRFILNNIDWEVCPPFYIINRSFLFNNHLQFYEGVFYEDNEFTPRLLFWANNIMVINQVLYFVNINPNSTTRKVNPKQAFGLILVAKSLYEFVQQNVKCKKTGSIFYSLISITLNSAIRKSVLLNENDYKTLVNIIYKEKKMMVKALLGSKSLKHNFQGIIISLSLSFFLKFYKDFTISVR